MISADNLDSLLELLRNMTPGHVSTLIASLNEPNSQIGTSRDSANYAFLLKLVELKLAEEIPLQVDLPGDIAEMLTTIVIKEEAKTDIVSLLKTTLDMD